MGGIYIHIPFCKQACYYCDFHFSTNQTLRDSMVEAQCREIELRKDYLGGENIETIYFGGGTPSLLDHNSLDLLLQTIHKNFTVSKEAEITLEANPDDISSELLTHWKIAGINRLSIGIQSFQEKVLTMMNRAHNPSEAIEAINLARSHGFENLNIDLIYGVPGFDHSRWQFDLDKVRQLKPEHISAYSLTIEENTVFGRWSKKGRFEKPDDNFAAEEFKMLVTQLSELGYDHYEVSNFSLPGSMSRHNTAYWKNEPYLGIGPGAHSYNIKERCYNISNNSKYIKAISRGQLPAEIERLTQIDNINEYLLTGLRTKWGVSISNLREKLNYDLMTIHNQYINEMIKNGYCKLNEDSLILTTSGLMIADKITSDLFSNQL